MELVLFYYTLLMLFVSILVAAVCLSAYLVSRKKTMLFLSVAFAFYFFDISLVSRTNLSFDLAGMRSHRDILSCARLLRW